MKCPKCSHEQSSETECEACGIIFEKYLKMQELLDHPIHSVSDRTPSRTPGIRLPRWANAIISIAIVWVILTFGLHLGTRSDTPVADPATETEVPVASGITKQLYAYKQPGNPIETSQLATVFIETPWGAGSGFFIDSDCRILTNKHVLTIDEAEIERMRHQAQILEHVITNKNMHILDTEDTFLGDADPQLSRYIEEQKKNSDVLTEQYAELKSRLETIEANRYNPTYTVILFDDSSYTVTGATLSETHDLALLQLSEEACPCLKPGKTDTLKTGQAVFTIGNPMGLSHTVTSGIISGKRSHEEHTFLQTDAPINPGNSGGPLIDEEGRVMGINTMILEGTEGIGFAIPIEVAMSEFEEIKEKQMVEGER